MICKNCANIFEDGFSCCPECGTPISSNYDVPEKSEGGTVVPPGELNQGDEPISEPDTFEEEIIPERSEWKPASKKEKSAMNVIVALTVAVFVILGVFTALSAFTDIFEESDDTVKTIALSGLSSEETKQLEAYLSDVGIVAFSDFCQGEDTEGGFIASYLNPGNAGSLYSKKHGAGEVRTTEADPAKRFINENGEYSYFVADADAIKTVLEEFGFTQSCQINEKNCYYYDGKYYFANSGDAFSSSVKARVISTIRSSDGAYYATCNFYDANTSDSSGVLETTVVFDKVTVDGVTQWEIIEISRDTYVDSKGVVTKNNKGDLSYEMKKETVENKDEGGRVIASVSFEYPSFKGTSNAEKSVNQLYASIIDSYKENPALIKENVTVTSRVAYNRNGRISIVEETVTGNAKMGMVTDENGLAAEGLVLPVKEIDGYILDAETGESLSKSNIFATDYSNVQFALYCIYSGYDMTAEDIPADREEIGKAIYASPNTMCEEGYTFFFVKDGYTERVVVPYSTEGFFAENYQGDGNRTQ